MNKESVEKREVNIKQFEEILLTKLSEKDHAFYINHVEYIEYLATKDDLWPTINVFICTNKWKENDETIDIVERSRRSSDKLEIMFSIISICRELFKQIYGETVKIDWITKEDAPIENSIS